MGTIGYNRRGKYRKNKLRSDKMPYINCVTSQKLTEEEKERIKESLGKLIEVFPGKSEQWLYVGFRDGESLYFRGQKMEKGAIVEVKLLGNASRACKDEFTAKVCDLLNEEISVPGNSTYVTFQEYAAGNWGWNDGLF